jgi:hypothetical protein
MISAQTRSAFVARENRFTLFRIMRDRHTNAKLAWHTECGAPIPAEILMTSINTDGQGGTQARSPRSQQGSERAFTLTFLFTSSVATFAWLYMLAQAALAATNWLIF